VRALGRLQLRADQPPPTLQLAEWQSIPRTLQLGVPAHAANFTFRLVEADFDLPVTLERREAVKLLPARVNSVQLSSVVSDDGVMLTQARVELTPGDKRLLHLTLPEGARFWFAFVNQASVWPWRQTNQILIPLETHARREATTLVEFFYSLPTARADGRSLHLALAGPRFDLPLENITWRVFLNRRWQLADWKGTLQLQGEQLAAAATLDLNSYMGREQSIQQAQMKTAEHMLNLGNTLLQQGDPQEARRAFQKAYGLSQHDNAFNEDARVQLHNLKMQQAMVGLNARQAAVGGDPAAPAARLRGLESGSSPVYTQEEARQILDRNSAEDNAVQLRLAERLVQQQDAAVPNPAAIRASIPEEGRTLTFSRTLLVDPWGDLQLQLKMRSPSTASRWTRLATLAAVFGMLVLLAWPARRVGST
jgi:tetratricopeptide (TPR) repeat protein